MQGLEGGPHRVGRSERNDQRGVGPGEFDLCPDQGGERRIGEALGGQIAAGLTVERLAHCLRVAGEGLVVGQQFFVGFCRAAELEFQLNSLAVVTTFVGIVGGETLTLPGEAPISLKDLRDAHEGWLPAYMGAEAAE